MQQHEFEKLTGMKVTEKQFEVITEMYMQNLNETKQEFCEYFMKMSKLEMLDDFYGVYHSLCVHSQKLKRMYEDARNRADGLEIELRKVKSAAEHWFDAWDKLSDIVRNNPDEK